MSMSKFNQRGFTILELLIATMVFSTIFLGATTALLQIGKLYYKGVVSGRTQEVTRGAVDQLSQQLQFSGLNLTVAPSQAYNVTGGTDPGGKLKFEAFCIGNTRYTYRINAQVSSGVAAGSYDAPNNRLQHALWHDTIPTGSCTAVDLSQTTPSAGGEEMLSQSMRLTDFKIDCPSNNMCNVSVSVIYGDNDLLTPDPTTATPTHCQSIIGSQWCAASQLTTSVLKRIGN